MSENFVNINGIYHHIVVLVDNFCIFNCNLYKNFIVFGTADATVEKYSCSLPVDTLNHGRTGHNRKKHKLMKH